jgi:tetratricopeptide (TPR) repeat protein
MKFTRIVSVMLLTLCVFTALHAQSGNNSIEGKVVDEKNIPVYNAYVELYNDFELLLSRARSSSQGRFTFRSLSPGRYTVRVKPFGTNLLEDSQRVEIVSITAGSSGVEFVDFRLAVDKRFQSSNPVLKGTVYAQAVPGEAKRKYDSGMNKLKSGDSKNGLTDLENSVQLFPTYFDALSSLGETYISAGKFEQGYPFLLRALDVYPRCADCYYSLGVAFYKLGQIPAGLKSAAAAVLLEPAAPEVHLLHGILLRLSDDPKSAETALLKSESLYPKPNAEVHWQLSLVYNALNQNAKAADRLELYLRDAVDLDKKQKDSVKAVIAKLRSAKASKT